MCQSPLYGPEIVFPLKIEGKRMKQGIHQSIVHTDADVRSSSVHSEPDISHCGGRCHLKVQIVREEEIERTKASKHLILKSLK